jgi:hypothetical protein
MSQATIRTRRWTRAEYARAIDARIFREDERLELLAGRLAVAEPKHRPHAVATGLVAEALRGAFGAGWYVQVQDPIALDIRSASRRGSTRVPAFPNTGSSTWLTAYSKCIARHNARDAGQSTTTSRSSGRRQASVLWPRPPPPSPSPTCFPNTPGRARGRQRSDPWSRPSGLPALCSVRYSSARSKRKGTVDILLPALGPASSFAPWCSLPAAGQRSALGVTTRQ